MIVHGGLVALCRTGEWRGALIQGPSGAGKSDLALRALDLGLRLVSDDRTIVWTSQGRLFGACPPAIDGLIEARGLGLVAAPRRLMAEIRLAVVCLSPDEPIERMPEDEQLPVLGVLLPVLRLHALEASSTAKLRWALSQLGARP